MGLLIIHPIWGWLCREDVERLRFIRFDTGTASIQFLKPLAHLLLHVKGVRPLEDQGRLDVLLFVT